MSTATQTRTAQLLSAQQLREQQEISGRAGLESLLKAVRRMLDWLLLPFRMIGRVLFRPKAGAEENPDDAGDVAASRAAASTLASDDEMSLGSVNLGKDGDAEIAHLAKQVSENPNGELDIEVTGKSDDLDVVVPMLMRQIDQILKTQLPADAQEAQVASHLVGLAESAERSRYAHRLVSREVESVMKTLAADQDYVGLSATTIEGMLRAAAKSPGAAAQMGNGSPEQRLLARLAVRDKIEADYAQQMRQIAVTLAPMLGKAKSLGELDGRGKDLLDAALRAAEVAGAKLRVRHAAHGELGELPETLPTVHDAVAKAISSVAMSIEEKAAPVAVAAPMEEPPAPAATATPMPEQSAPAVVMAAVVLDKPASDEILVGEELEGEEFAGLVKEGAEAASGVTEQAMAPAVTAPSAPVGAIKALARSSVGMFGSVATAQRTAADLEAENVIDDLFEMEAGENLVGG